MALVDAVCDVSSRFSLPGVGSAHGEQIETEEELNTEGENGSCKDCVPTHSALKSLTSAEISIEGRSCKENGASKLFDAPPKMP
jgi:hypothetical protein